MLKEREILKENKICVQLNWNEVHTAKACQPLAQTSRRANYAAHNEPNLQNQPTKNTRTFNGANGSPKTEIEKNWNRQNGTRGIVNPTTANKQIKRATNQKKQRQLESAQWN